MRSDEVHALLDQLARPIPFVDDVERVTSLLVHKKLDGAPSARARATNASIESLIPGRSRPAFTMGVDWMLSGRLLRCVIGLAEHPSHAYAKRAN